METGVWPRLERALIQAGNRYLGNHANVDTVRQIGYRPSRFLDSGTCEPVRLSDLRR